MFGLVLASLLPSLLAALRHFRGHGMSPGPMGACVFAPFVASSFGIPWWGCLLLAVAALILIDFGAWILTCYVLDWVFPKPDN